MHARASAQTNIPIPTQPSQLQDFISCSPEYSHSLITIPVVKLSAISVESFDWPSSSLTWLLDFRQPPSNLLIREPLYHMTPAGRIYYRILNNFGYYIYIYIYKGSSRKFVRRRATTIYECIIFVVYGVMRDCHALRVSVPVPVSLFYAYGLTCIYYSLFTILLARVFSHVVWLPNSRTAADCSRGLVKGCMRIAL